MPMPEGVTQCAACHRVLFTKDADAAGKCPDCAAGKSPLSEPAFMPNPFTGAEAPIAPPATAAAPQA